MKTKQPNQTLRKILATGLISFALAGCGGSNSDESKAESASTSPTASAQNVLGVWGVSNVFESSTEAKGIHDGVKGAIIYPYAKYAFGDLSLSFGTKGEFQIHPETERFSETEMTYKGRKIHTNAIRYERTGYDLQFQLEAGEEGEDIEISDVELSGYDFARTTYYRWAIMKIAYLDNQSIEMRVCVNGADCETEENFLNFTFLRKSEGHTIEWASAEAQENSLDRFFAANERREEFNLPQMLHRILGLHYAVKAYVSSHSPNKTRRFETPKPPVAPPAVVVPDADEPDEPSPSPAPSTPTTSDDADQ